MPIGPPSLWALTVSASAPLSSNDTGIDPTAWTASVWNAIP